MDTPGENTELLSTAPHGVPEGSESIHSLAGELTISQVQSSIDDWIRSVGVRYFDEMTNLAQLVEEVGEVARILSRTCGEQSTKPGESLGDLGDELADVLFVVVCLANQSGINLQDAIKHNLDKKTNRDRSRHRTNPKLNP